MMFAWYCADRAGFKTLPLAESVRLFADLLSIPAPEDRYPRLSIANTSPPSPRARARARGGSENQRPWPADKVERWSIDRLIPYAKNARTHSDAQIAAIAASIKEWGWTTPPRLPRGDVGQVRVVVPSDRPVRVGATMQTLAAQGRSFPPPHAGAVHPLWQPPRGR